MLKKIALVLIILAVLVLNVLRFWKLDTVPYGFHVDEMGTAVTMECFVEKGCDAETRPWPLYGSMEYGQDKPPTYVYPGILWGKAFGTTVPSFRAYGVFGLLIGILGLFFLSRKLFGKSFALVVVLAATCSPWAWVVTRVAIESYFAPVFVIWGLYFFWRSNTWWNWALVGFLFACAMYDYPPARLQVPLMLMTLIIYEWSMRRIEKFEDLDPPAKKDVLKIPGRPFKWFSFISLSAAFYVSLKPMIVMYKRGELVQRFNDISIFNKEYLHSLGVTGTPWDCFTIFVHNYLLHLSPDFLFLTGDPSYVHSTRHLGLFSWLDIAALAILVVFLVLVFARRSWQDNPVVKNWPWLILLAVNFFIGIIPSALTNQELPHALRICGSWPFMMLFTGFMWWAAAECLKFLWPAIALGGILCGGVLVYQYFTVYPQASRGMFDYWIKDTAEQIQTPEDWQKFLVYFHRQNYHERYFMVHKLGMTCKQAYDTWWSLYHYLADRKEF